MNYLAHAFLSRGDTHLLAGNYLADLLTKKEADDLHPHLQQGVALHRFIDEYTDGHPEVRACTRFFHDAVHKYAPVVVDICFDFLLCQHWPHFTDQDIDQFRKETYRLLTNESLIPVASQWRLQRMVEDDWLARNASFEGLHRTLEYVAKRAKFKVDFAASVDVLREHQVQLGAHFVPFFEELQKSSDEWIANNFSLTQL